MSAPPSVLPYQDSKPQGAPDFYFGINATFRFIHSNLGMQGLIDYWEDLGRSYMKPVWSRWQQTGLEGIAAYWRAFFAAEPGGIVEVSLSETEVVLAIAVCPAIKHLREGGRVILPEFCEHCHYISAAAARCAGYNVHISGGNGSCRQRFFPAADGNPPPTPGEIRRC